MKQAKIIYCLWPAHYNALIMITLNKSHHFISHRDQFLIDAIENHVLQLTDFNHETHVKLAYCYLTQLGLKNSVMKMSNSLKGFLKAKGVASNKFHATLTEAWLKAVWHFMQQSNSMQSADEFIQANPVLLNKNILLSHYSQGVLFSEQARIRFVEPDLNPLPSND